MQCLRVQTFLKEKKKHSLYFLQKFHCAKFIKHFQRNTRNQLNRLTLVLGKKTNYIELQSSLKASAVSKKEAIVSLIRNKNVIISKRKLYFQSNNFTIENIKLHTFQSASVTKCVFILHLL